MSPTRLQTIFAGVILLCGIFAAYGLQLLNIGEETQAQTYVMDVDFWQRTPRETQVLAAERLDLGHSLSELPLQLGEWVGEDVPQTNVEVFMLLDPEQYIQRLYRNSQGDYMWLSLVGGRSSRPFHPPDICYIADGWQVGLSSQQLSLPNGGEVTGMWLDANKGDVGHRVFYFYLFPNAERQPGEGIVLVKLTAGTVGDREVTIAQMTDFLGQLLLQTTSEANS